MFQAIEAIFRAPLTFEESDMTPNCMAQQLRKDESGLWENLIPKPISLRRAKREARLIGVFGGAVVRVIRMTPNGDETVWEPLKQ